MSVSEGLRGGQVSPVQCGVLVLPQLVNDWLDAQHEEFVPEVEAEVQVVLEKDEEEVNESEWVSQ